MDEVSTSLSLRAASLVLAQLLLLDYFLVTMRLTLVLCALVTAATAASASTVPPELAVIGEPSTILNLTYSVGSTEISFKPGDFLNSTSMPHKTPFICLNFLLI